MYLKFSHLIIILAFYSGNLLSQIEFQKSVITNNADATCGLCKSDIDSDGDPDLIGALSGSNRIAVWFNNLKNTGSWERVDISGYFPEAKSIHTADINSDGLIDVIGAASGGGGEIAVFYNNGNSRTFTKSVIKNNYSWAHEVYAEDMDNDGDMDILGVSSALNQVTLWVNQGGNPATWKEKIIKTGFMQAKSVAAADINNDGKMDIVAASLLSHSIKWWKNTSTEELSFKEYTITYNFSGAHRVNIFDIDKDGDQDILASGWIGNEVAWWENAGGDPVIWKKQTIGTNILRTCQSVAGDFNNDGFIDVAATSQEGNALYLWSNKEFKPFVWDKKIVDNNFKKVWPLVSGDFDGDGDLDIVASSGQDGIKEIRFYENRTIINTTGINDELPTGFELKQNYPNPFNPSTVIEFTLEESGETFLKLLDIKGELIKTLFFGYKQAGKHKLVFDGSGLSSGVYLYQLRSKNFFETKKMMIIK